MIAIGYFNEYLDVERYSQAMKVVFRMNENFYSR